MIEVMHQIKMPKEYERESSLNVSLYKHNIDIFEEGIKSPCSSCFLLSSLTKEAQIKDTRHMEEINKSITFISKKFEEMEDNRKKKERQITELKK